MPLTWLFAFSTLAGMGGALTGLGSGVLLTPILTLLPLSYILFFGS